MQVSPRHLQRREQAEHHRGGDGNANRIRQRAPIDAPLDVVGNLVHWNGRRDEPRPNLGEGDAERNAGQAEDDTFGEQLPDDASATRADCHAHGKLATSSGSSSQQQIGDIRARNEQDECDASHHQVEHERHVVRDEGLTERADVRLPPVVGGRILLRQSCSDDVQLFGGALPGHAGLHSSECEQIPCIADRL